MPQECRQLDEEKCKGRAGNCDIPERDANDLCHGGKPDDRIIAQHRTNAADRGQQEQDRRRDQLDKSEPADRALRIPSGIAADNDPAPEQRQKQNALKNIAPEADAETLQCSAGL